MLSASITLHKKSIMDNPEELNQKVQKLVSDGLEMAEISDLSTFVKQLEGAGLVVSQNKVVIKAQETVVVDDGNNELALFSGGSLNANLINADTITVNHLYAKSAQGGSVVGHFGNYDKSDAVAGNDKCPLWLGAATAANAPFRVTKDGAMYAVKGTIGGFVISSSDLKWSDSSSINSMTLMGSGVSFSNGDGDTHVGKVKAAFGTYTLDGTHAMYPVIHITQKLDHSDVFARNIAVHLDVTGNIPSSAYSNTILGDFCPGNHAIMIENGDIAGLRLNIRQVNSSYTITKYDNIVVNYATNSNTILQLPNASDCRGQVIFIINKNGYKCTIKGTLWKRGSSTSETLTEYGKGALISDGTHWIWFWFSW